MCVLMYVYPDLTTQSTGLRKSPRLLLKLKFYDLGVLSFEDYYVLINAFHSTNFRTLYGLILSFELSCYQSVAYNVTADQGSRLL